ncbi:MAG: hypothetical protein VB934_20140 [Polyangiaceae bacterium]
MDIVRTFQNRGAVVARTFALAGITAVFAAATLFVSCTGVDETVDPASLGSDTDVNATNLESCSKITVICTDDLSGLPANTAAAADRVNCKMALTTETCKHLGVKHNQSITSQDLDKLIDECKNDDLEQATLCCVIKHEKTHLDDGPKPHSCETETNAYSAQVKCLEVAKKENCGSVPKWDELDCGQLPEDITLWKRAIAFNECVCTHKDNITPEVCAECVAACNPKKDPDDAKWCKVFNCHYCQQFLSEDEPLAECTTGPDGPDA